MCMQPLPSSPVGMATGKLFSGSGLQWIVRSRPKMKANSQLHSSTSTGVRAEEFNPRTKEDNQRREGPS